MRDGQEEVAGKGEDAVGDELWRPEGGEPAKGGCRVMSGGTVDAEGEVSATTGTAERRGGDGRVITGE